MQVLHTQIHKARSKRYILWDGEVVVKVTQHTGVHGFHSAAIVVERMDGPLEVYARDWYSSTYSGMYPKPSDPMLMWIAEQLTKLSTGTHNNLGGVGSVEGLKM